jgi:O-antigen/teichoic acid export membrane protein
MTERPRSHRFLENVSWNLLKQVATALVSFFLTPVLVHGLGKERYALYALIGVILGYLSTLTLGAGTAAIRFISEAGAAQDSRRLRDSYRYAIAFHLVLPGLAGLALAFGASRATGWFGVPAGQEEACAQLFRMVAFGGILFVLGQAGVAALVGLDRFGLYSTMETIYTLFLLGGSALLVYLGFGLREIGQWFLAVNILYALATLAAARHILAGRLAHPGAQHRPLAVWEFAKYALPVFFGQLFWVANFQTDKLFIATLLPLAALTYYFIPFAIVQRLETLPRSISFAALQMASELSGLGRVDSLRRLYMKSTKLLWLTMTPALVLLFAYAPQFLTLWLGPEFSDHGTWPLRLLLVAFSFYFLGQVPLTMSQGMGKPHYPTISLGIGTVISFCLWSIFIPRYGIMAAAAGLGVAQAVASCWLLARFHRELIPIRWVEFLHEGLLPPFLAGSALLGLCLMLHLTANTWPRLIGSVLAGLAVFYGLSYWLLDSEERKLFWQIARFRQAPAKQ